MVGIGYSSVHRAKGVDGRGLAVDAARAAIADAGLAISDVDGIFEYAGNEQSYDLAKMLGIENLVVFGDFGPWGPSAMSSVVGAHMAVQSGACDVALVLRSVTREWGQQSAEKMLPPPSGMWQWDLPYGIAGGMIPVMAMKMRRRFHTLGGTPEDYGHIAVNARRWSSLNERAVLRDLISIDDYLNSRMVSDPVHLFDCDYPVTGACAVVITSTQRAADTAKAPVFIDAIAMGTGWKPDWTYTDDFLFGGTRRCAETMWKRSSVTPVDVDVAQLYDGFTHITVSWIEAMGFCGIGEFGDWVDAGSAIGPGGVLPLNTQGGQLAEGRLHGLSFLAEGVAQLRGECGARQVPDAQVAVVANAHGPHCASLVLTT